MILKPASPFFIAQIIVFIVLLSNPLVSSAQFDQVPDSIEYQALVDLYNSTNGAAWKNKTNWLNGSTSAEFGTWYGIEILNGDVKSIKLSSNNLDGYLSSSLGDLRKLSYLHLYSNKLKGVIPATVGDLPLAQLRLNNNQLSDSIPASIFQRSIQTVNLSHNNLTGSLPNFGDIAIEYLYLQFNKLTGPIPESIGKISGLYRLDLNDNQFTGPLPQAFGNLATLRFLRLNNNRITGEIPSSVGNMTVLRYLSLSGNQLTGTLPSSMGKLKHLSSLNISANNLNRPLPDSIVFLSALNYLDLRFNDIPGNIPNDIGNLKNLTSLYLNVNKMEGQLPESLGTIPNLAVLHLAHNNFSGNLPGTFEGLTKLTNLSIYNNKFTGGLPEAMRNFTDIRLIDIKYNAFSAIPDFSGNVNSAMISVRISNNKMGFEALEPNMSDINQPIFRQFFYDTQSPQAADTLAFTVGQPVVLDAEDNAPRNRYQWQRLINGVWRDISGTHGSTFTIASMDSSAVGSYRCRMTNDWVTSLTIFSKTSVIQETSEYWSVADGNWTTDRIWSTTRGGTPVTGYPQGASKVFIVGNNITLSNSLSCGTVEVIVENKEASLTVDGAEMIVQGELRLTKSTEGHPGNVKVINGGKVQPVD